MNNHYPDGYHGYSGHRAPGLPSMGYTSGYGDPATMARMMHSAREGYPMPHYPVMQSAGAGLYNQASFMGQPTASGGSPYVMNSYETYGMPGMHQPTVQMSNRPADMSRQNPGNNMSSTYYNPAISSDSLPSYNPAISADSHPSYNPAISADSHPSPHRAGPGSQQSTTFSRMQANAHIQQPHMTMASGHHNIAGQPAMTGQSVASQPAMQGQSGTHKTHGMSQASPHQASAASFGSQHSPHMTAHSHHIPQHPMRHTSTQQNPQEVADNILQMASSYPSNQTVQVPLKGRPAPYHIPRSPHYNMSQQSTDHPHTSPVSHHQSQSSPIASCQSSPSPSSSVKSPTPVLAPIPNPISSPGINGLRSPCNQGMSPCSSQRSPAHISSSFTGQSPASQPSQGGDSFPAHNNPSDAPCYSPCNMGQGHSFPSLSVATHIHRNSSLYSASCDQSSTPHPGFHHSSYSGMVRSSPPVNNMSPYAHISNHPMAQSSHTTMPLLDLGSSPLMSLQKLVMLPETQVVDPKSVVNDTCLSSRDQTPKNVNNPAEWSAESSGSSAGCQLQSSSPTCPQSYLEQQPQLMDNMESSCEMSSHDFKEAASAVLSFLPIGIGNFNPKIPEHAYRVCDKGSGSHPVARLEGSRASDKSSGSHSVTELKGSKVRNKDSCSPSVNGLESNRVCDKISGTHSVTELKGDRVSDNGIGSHSVNMLEGNGACDRNSGSHCVTGLELNGACDRNSGSHCVTGLELNGADDKNCGSHCVTGLELNGAGDKNSGLHCLTELEGSEVCDKDSCSSSVNGLEGDRVCYKGNDSHSVTELEGCKVRDKDSCSPSVNGLENNRVYDKGSGPNSMIELEDSKVCDKGSGSHSVTGLEGIDPVSVGGCIKSVCLDFLPAVTNNEQNNVEVAEANNGQNIVEIAGTNNGQNNVEVAETNHGQNNGEDGMASNGQNDDKIAVTSIKQRDAEIRTSVCLESSPTVVGIKECDAAVVGDVVSDRRHCVGEDAGENQEQCVADVRTCGQTSQVTIDLPVSAEVGQEHGDQDPSNIDEGSLSVLEKSQSIPAFIGGVMDEKCITAEDSEKSKPINENEFHSLERKNGKVKDEVCFSAQCHSPTVLSEVPILTNSLSSQANPSDHFDDIIKDSAGNGVCTKIQNAFSSLLKVRLARVKKVAHLACVTPCSIAVGAEERAACDRFSFGRNGVCRVLTPRVVCNGSRSRSDSTGNCDSDDSLENTSEHSFGQLESPQDGVRKKPAAGSRQYDRKKANLHATPVSRARAGNSTDNVTCSNNGCTTQGSDMVSDDDASYYEGVDSYDVFINNFSSDESVVSKGEVKQHIHGASTDEEKDGTAEGEDGDSKPDIPEHLVDSESPLIRNTHFKEQDTSSMPSSPPSKRLRRSSAKNKLETAASQTKTSDGISGKADEVIDLTGGSSPLRLDTMVSPDQNRILGSRSHRGHGSPSSKFQPSILSHKLKDKVPVVVLEKSSVAAAHIVAVKEENTEVSLHPGFHVASAGEDCASTAAGTTSMCHLEPKPEHADSFVEFKNPVDKMCQSLLEVCGEVKDVKLIGSLPARHKRKIRRKPVRTKTTSKHGSKLIGKVSKDSELRDSFKSMKFSRTLDLMKARRKREQSSLGPFVRVVGKQSAPDTVTVFVQPVLESTMDTSSGRHKNVQHKHSQPSSTSPAIHLMTSLPTDKSAMVSSTRTIGQNPWVCAFCSHHSSYRFLGDLYGPYFPDSEIAAVEKIATEESKKSDATKDLKSTLALVTRRNKEVGSTDTRMHLRGKSPAQVTFNKPALLTPQEVWVHELCAMWSPGVFLVGNKLYGLEEAIRDATETVCSACRLKGAMIGCLHKGCPMKFHYVCAIDKECFMDEEKLSLLCPKHKGKKVKGVVDMTDV